MATESYHSAVSRAYGEPAGVRLLASLESSGTDPFNASQALAEGAALGLTPHHAIVLLNELSKAGRITRIKKGLYAINDPLTRSPKAHPFAIGTAIVNPWPFSTGD